MDRAEALLWYQGALGELGATLAAQDMAPTGPAGGIFANELFAEERGQATIFVPCQPPPRAMGRVTATVISFGRAGNDRAPRSPYRYRLGLRGPGHLRDPPRPCGRGTDPRVLLVGPSDTRDESAWRTEVGWPIFRTRPH